MAAGPWMASMRDVFHVFRAGPPAAPVMAQQGAKRRRRTLLLRIDADPLPWTMLAIAALVVSASAGGLSDVGARALETDAAQASLLPGSEGDCRRDLATVDCQSLAQGSARVRLSAAGFQPGSADLPESLAEPLRRIGQALRDQHAVVRVEVHTDASGSADGNRALSQRRAEAIRSFLIGTGVSPYQVHAVGLGAGRPLVAADPLAAGNRRIEIVRL